MAARSGFFLIFLCLLLSFSDSAKCQTVSKLIITDNLAAQSKFGYGKPKPAAPKDHFIILPDKGTQVLFFAEMDTTKSPEKAYKLKFSAYRTNDNKIEWIDERDVDMKATSSVALSAFNFFDEGNYKIVVTPVSDLKNVLSEATFVISK